MYNMIFTKLLIHLFILYHVPPYLSNPCVTRLCQKICKIALAVCYYSQIRFTSVISKCSDSSCTDQIILIVAIPCSAFVIFIASWWQAYWEVRRFMIKYQFSFKSHHRHIILFSMKYFLGHQNIMTRMILQVKGKVKMNVM